MKSATEDSSETFSTWLPGGEPKPGRIARGFIRGMDDIREIERHELEDLLPAGTIPRCIELAAELDPDKPAFQHLVSADIAVPPRVITYRELVTQMRACASLFQELSAGEKPSVAIILPMLPEALIASWGASGVGVGCPINPFLEMKYVTSIMNTARTTVLVTTTNAYGPGAWDNIEAVRNAVPTLKKILIVGSNNPDDDFATAVQSHFEKGADVVLETDPEADANYLPTGGTTDAPKLVRMTHRGQLINAWLDGALGGPAPNGVVGHAMPNFHVGGCVVLALRAVLYGQTVLTLTTDGFRSPAVVRNFWDIARRYRMTTVLATPATAAALLATPGTTAEGHTFQTFHCGGSTIPVELANAFHARFGVWLREMWGMTEVHGVVTSHPSGFPPVVGSVGAQLPHQPIKAFIVDERNNFVRECAPGERGVLVISGKGVTSGYVDPSLNASFHVNGSPDERRWGNTGDLGTVDENGYVWVFGRTKDVIVRGGHNIDANLIEEVLVRHPAVQLAAAIGRPDGAKGELPIAYVQLRQDAEADEAELLALCRENVQERAAIPLYIRIIPRMPMTAVGKIAKPVLRREAIQDVASEIAARIVGGSGVRVWIDESGKRPKAVITLAASPDAEDKVAALKAAFQTYEFETRIEVD